MAAETHPVIPTRIEWIRDGTDIRPIIYDRDQLATLTIPVTSEDDARAIVAAIERLDNAAPKKTRKSRKVPSAPGAEPSPKGGSAAGARAEADCCIAPGCKFDEESPGSLVCRDHASATTEQRAEWLRLRVDEAAKKPALKAAAK